MKFNFKNLSENTKRIRIIPKNDTKLFANIGVDNPTAMMGEDGVFSVCLSPYETPTNNCDDSPSSIILPLTGGSYYEIVDGDAVYGSILRNLIVGASDQNYFEGLRFEVVTGTNIDPTTVRIVNLTDNSKRIKFTALDANSLNERYFAEKGLNYAETVLAHNVESLGDGVVFEFCLGPSDGEIPSTISCDGATDYVDFAILVREGVSHDVVSTSLSTIFDGEILPPMTPPPDWVEESQADPFPYEIPNGFQDATLTPRFYNLSDVNRRVELKSLSDDIKVFAYNNPTSIQLSDDNSHAGACLSKGCMPSEIYFDEGIYDLDYGALYGMNMTLQTPKGTVSGDFLIPLPEYSNTLYYLIEQYLYENISLISDDPAQQLVSDSGGGSSFIRIYRNIRGGNGSLGGSPFDLILKPLEGAGFDVYGFHFENSETVIHVCGLENFPGY